MTTANTTIVLYDDGFNYFMTTRGNWIFVNNHDIKDDNKTGDEDGEYVFISNTEIEETPIRSSSIEMSPRDQKNDGKK
jgi:hypothetical protein